MYVKDIQLNKDLMRASILQRGRFHKTIKKLNLHEPLWNVSPLHRHVY